MYDFNFSAKSYFVAPYLFLLCCSTYFQSSLKSQPIFSLATGLDRNHSFATTKMKLFNLTSPLKTWIILAFFFFYIILMPFYFLSFSI